MRFAPRSACALTTLSLAGCSQSPELIARIRATNLFEMLIFGPVCICGIFGFCSLFASDKTRMWRRMNLVLALFSIYEFSQANYDASVPGGNTQGSAFLILQIIYGSLIFIFWYKWTGELWLEALGDRRAQAVHRKKQRQLQHAHEQKVAASRRQGQLEQSRSEAAYLRTITASCIGELVKYAHHLTGSREEDSDVLSFMISGSSILVEKRELAGVIRNDRAIADEVNHLLQDLSRLGYEKTIIYQRLAAARRR